jgi:hypothetical protein
MSLPVVTFSIGSRSVDVGAWTANDAEGGYDQASGIMTERAWRQIGSPSQGATVKAYTDGPTLIWSGRLAQPPQVLDGIARFAAVGLNAKAEAKGSRLFIQSADMTQWVPYDSEPHLNGSDVPVYPRMRKIGLDSTKGALRFSLTKDQQLNTGEEAVFIFYTEGVDLGGGKIWWTGTWNAIDDFSKLEFRVQKADGPTGAETGVASFTLIAGNRDVAKSQTIGGASTNDLITFGLRCNDGTFAPNASRMVWSATHVRVNSSITSADSYNASDVVTYIGGQMGWDTAGVTTSTFDVLPFDWENGSWLDALTYVADLEDKYVRVGDNAVEYDAWGTTNWTVTEARTAVPDLKPLELFNQARVDFESSAGVQRKSTRTTTDVGITDPLADAGITNTITATLEDRQKIGSTLPANVADKLVRRYARQRYSGTIDVAAARSNTSATNPRLIRYGDTITIADWSEGASLTLRVVEVSQTPEGVTIGVEQPVNVAALIAHTSGRRRHHKRKNGPRHHHGGGGHHTPH